MKGIHRNSDRQVHAEAAIKKCVLDTEDYSITLAVEESDRGLQASDVAGATTVATDGQLYDSLGSLGILLNNESERKIDRDPEACRDFVDELDNSLRSVGLLQASRMSSGSFDISSSYGEETSTVNSNKKRQTTREAGYWLWWLKCLFFCLLVLSAILSVLSIRNSNAKACGFANLVVIVAIVVVSVTYDYQLREREASLIKSVTRSEAIVNSLFPEIVRDRILEEGNFVSSRNLVLPPSRSRSSSLEMAPPNKNNHLPGSPVTADLQIWDEENGNHESCNSISSKTMDDPTMKIPEEKIYPMGTALRSSLSSRPTRRRSNDSGTGTFASEAYGDGDSSYHQGHKAGSIAPGSAHSSPAPSKPIADYFPSATIMFADIVGFTSWASIREPAQVFELLETLYGRFDRIAKKKGVFKVETIGDCYVAATGLPNVMNDHAIAMASFARRCLESMLETVADLEESLGPGTSDLGLRIGIHSGSVIGGVLRGTKSRYQLFGDTMNTASRIESTSSKNKIQLSEQAAELIMEAGKKPWVEQRKDAIFAKGKGELKTYWLTTEGPKNLSAKEKVALPAILKMMAKANIDPGFIKKKKALDRNEKLERLIDYHTNVLKGLLNKLAAVHHSRPIGGSDVDAYTEKVEKFFDPNGEALANKKFAEDSIGGMLFPTLTADVSISSNAATRTIDASVSDQLRELVSRVAKWHRDDLPFHTFEHASHTVLSITKLLAAVETCHQTTDTILNKTKSMITHPLTEFVLVFAALVQNVDDEDERYTRMADAEKATRRAWSLFLEPSFRDLRRSICRTRYDFEFFRRLLGKSIMVITVEANGSIGHRSRVPSTGFPSSEIGLTENQEASQNALAIVEKLLRVSDVSYALQHFPVFKKWNKLLFDESYGAYKSETNSEENTKEDPSVYWYDRELEFFDDRIRLVRGLRDSEICNKLADVYLSAAIANRREWEQKGKPIVEEYLSKQ